MGKDLAEIIVKAFPNAKPKRASAKAVKSKHIKNKILQPKFSGTMVVSSIASILIKSAVEDAKRAKKEKGVSARSSSYKLLKEEKQEAVNSGYGTVSKNYGTSPVIYADYEKLFSYLGAFRTKGLYGNAKDHVSLANKVLNNGNNSSLIDYETIEKATKYIKNFAPGLDISASTIVPQAGMTSAEWEEFKWWMRLNPVLYRLKMSTS